MYYTCQPTTGVGKAEIYKQVEKMEKKAELFACETALVTCCPDNYSDCGLREKHVISKEIEGTPFRETNS